MLAGPATAQQCGVTELLQVNHEPCTISSDPEPPPKDQVRAGGFLCDAVMTGYKLANAKLTQAKMITARLDGADLRKAELVGADLSAASLAVAVLEKADLSGATLRGATFRDVHASGANFSQTDLFGAHLSGDFRSVDFSNATWSETRACDADFTGAILKGQFSDAPKFTRVDFSRSTFNGMSFVGFLFEGLRARDAKFRGADFSGANLSNADLEGADLSGAKFRRTNLTGTRLVGADLTGAVYEPEGDPPVQLVGLKGLDQVSFAEGRDEGLFKLRRVLRDAGLRDLERQATYAIEHNRALQDRKSGMASRVIEGWFRTVLFDWTTAYGMRPGRPLFVLLLSFVVFTPLYAWAIWRGHRKTLRAAIFKVLPKDRIIESDEGAKTDVPMEVTRLSVPLGDAVKWGAYFSLASAFYIGFREFNVGSWISRLTPSKFTLDATGWVRTVSGIQSLISVLLVALAVLTYFGRPFD